ncbi:B3 domain-containing transcription factor VRN1 isoform X1 [Hevea brasiliensis]|nr:B3 domain-containing transcription factor VRN1 isoform X1 [Hevea brasiliensis]
METAPHFFKIILDNTIRQGKLGIPRKFVRKYGNDLSSPVILSVPSGAIWRVELLKCDGDVWLGQGWQDFSNYYSLEHGNFLVFKYEGDCQFHVLIFNKSASEIEYPCNNIYNANPDHDELQDNKIEENEDDTSVEALDDQSQCKKMGEKSTFLCAQSRKLMQSRCKKNEHRKVGTPTSCPIPSQALDAANKFITEYPSFNVVLKQYHLVHSYVVVLPSFFLSHFERKTQNILLQIADRMWPVKLICPSGKGPAVLSAGWRVFSRENALEVGDVCVFELIKRNVLNVSIFRCVN